MNSLFKKVGIPLCLSAFVALSANPVSAYTGSGTGDKVPASAAVATGIRQNKKVYNYKLSKRKISRIKKVDVHLSSADIELRKSGDKNFYFSYNLACRNKRNPLSYSVKNGVLKIKESGLEWPGDFINMESGNTNYNINKYKNKIYVYVPSGAVLENCIADTDNGDIDIDNISLKNLDVKTGNGDLDISGAVLPGSAKIKTDNGDLDISDTLITGKINVISDNGDFDIEDTKINGLLDIDTDNGDLDAEGLNIKGKVKINSGSGDISIELDNKSISKTGIKISSHGGEVEVSKKYKGSKKKKGDGCYYEKSANGGGSLSIVADAGDVSLE